MNSYLSRITQKGPSCDIIEKWRHNFVVKNWHVFAEKDRTQGPKPLRAELEKDRDLWQNTFPPYSEAIWNAVGGGRLKTLWIENFYHQNQRKFEQTGLHIVKF